MRRYFRVALQGAVLVPVACGGGGTNPVIPPAAVAPPQIRAIQVVPSTVPLGGTAQISVDAVDPAGGPVTCRFVAQAGAVSLPDSAHAPCSGLYQNDGSVRTSDNITVTATNSANLSTVSSASLALTDPVVAAPPGGNPRPTPAPVPPTVSVKSSGDCHPTWNGPGCPVTFIATTTNATSVSWSDCASGMGTTSTCIINSITTVTAVATAAGPGGTAQSSASAHGVNSPAYVGCGGNPYHFSAPSDQGISLSVNDPDGDPASAGSVFGLSFSGGSVYGAGYQSGNVWIIGIHVEGPGAVSWIYKDAWGAATQGTCTVQVP